jgi:FAD/FMN-containing dehydrogenase
MESLQTVFRGDIDVSPETLELHSVDASMFKVTPSAVVYPRDSKDVMALVSWVNQERERGNGYTLSPRGAGTCMSGGSLTTGIMVDMTRYMNAIISVDGDFATVEPGCYFRDLEKELAEDGMFFPPFPASHNLCALGGMFGNNCAGEKTLRFGKFEQWIESSKIVLSDGKEYTVRALTSDELDQKCNTPSFEGKLYRSLRQLISENYDLVMSEKPHVSKNSAGYYLWNVYDQSTGKFDLNRLLVGSQGTLGIITEMTIRTHPIEKESGMAVYMLHNLEKLGDIVSEIAKFKPTSVESFDDTSLGLAFRYWWDFVKQIGLFGAIMLGIKFIPELGMLLRGGIPKLILMVEVTAETKKRSICKTSGDFKCNQTVQISFANTDSIRCKKVLADP